MAPSDSQDVDVLALRCAAEAGDWNACLNAMKKLLLRIPTRRALELGHHLVMARLPGFERHQPGVTWPREFIETVTGVGTPDSRSWPADDAFAGPGANNFIRAVEHLWEASRIVNDDEKRVGALVQAIANAIMAERLEDWGARHLEQWTRWYQEIMEGKRRVENQRLQRDMVFGPEGMKIERQAWLEVAEFLEEALSHPGGSTP